MVDLPYQLVSRISSINRMLIFREVSKQKITQPDRFLDARIVNSLNQVLQKKFDVSFSGAVIFCHLSDEYPNLSLYDSKCRIHRKRGSLLAPGGNLQKTAENFLRTLTPLKNVIQSRAMNPGIFGGDPVQVAQIKHLPVELPFPPLGRFNITMPVPY